jgi:hypothetical protein
LISLYGIKNKKKNKNKIKISINNYNFSGTCKIEDLFQYADNKDKFSKTVRRKNFHDGIQELEEDLKKNPNPVYGDSTRGMMILKILKYIYILSF